MKILRSWLNEFANFGNDVDAIAASLTKLGLAVESVEQVGLPVKGVVVAKVLRTERHPDAAKVHRVYVDAGDGVAVQVDRQDQGAQDQQPGLVRRQPPPEQHGGGGGDRDGAAPG